MASYQSLFNPMATWQPDDARTTCSARLCDAPLKRGNRHHCRWCGQLFCSSCAPATRSYQGSRHRCCNACRLPAVFQATWSPTTGRLDPHIFDVIQSFLTPRDVTALLQSCYAMLSSYPLTGAPYHLTVQERFPSLFDGAHIGSGGFAKAYKCEDPNDPERRYVVVKILPKVDYCSASAWKRVQREWSIHGACQHPCIARLLEVFQTPDTVVFVTEAGDGGTLYNAVEYLEATQMQREPFVAHVIQQVVLGMQYLYDTFGVVHRDIKSDNIVLSADYSRVFLIDLGLAEKVTDSRRDHVDAVGAAAFASPECLSAVIAHTKLPCDSQALLRSDLYSLGVVAYTVLSGFFPFPRTRGDEQQLAAQLKGPGFPAQRWSTVSMGCTDVLTLLLSPNPARRPSMADILKDQWIQHASARMPAVIQARSQLLAEQHQVLSEFM